MKITRRNPEIHLPNGVDSFFDSFFNEHNNGRSNAFTPRTDIAETEEGFEIQLAVPGMSKQDFKIDLNKGQLSVSGERKLNEEQKGRNYHSLQTEYGSFNKSFQLPDNIDEKKIDAKYEDGILSIVIPKDKAKKLASTILVK